MTALMLSGSRTSGLLEQVQKSLRNVPTPRDLMHPNGTLTETGRSVRNIGITVTSATYFGWCAARLGLPLLLTAAMPALIGIAAPILIKRYVDQKLAEAAADDGHDPAAEVVTPPSAEAN